MSPRDLLPDEKKCEGLHAARQWYLFEQIGQFFLKSDIALDSVCLKPVVLKTEIKLDIDNNVKNGGKRKSSLLL
jgi:hypothetical protein